MAAKNSNIGNRPKTDVPGRRARNRIAKEAAIREAARRLFVTHGYDATTLRAVADEADVGFGTVFSYAIDKAGLLAMVFVAELDALPPLFPPKPHASSQPLLDTLIDGMAPLYMFWASIPSLSAQVLQQLEFYGGNSHIEAIIARRAEAKDALQGWLQREREAGRIVANIDPAEAADTLFAIYTSAVREWSATAPDNPAAGLARLRRLMALPVSALKPASP